MPWEKRLKDWGRVRVKPAIELTVAFDEEEWLRLRKFASDQGMTMAAVLRAGARFLMKEKGVKQPEPMGVWVDPVKGKS